jgi:hypothetical protein
MAKMTTIAENYNRVRAGIVELLKTARAATARNVNSIMTAAYWEIGRRIVEMERLLARPMPHFDGRRSGRASAPHLEI